MVRQATETAVSASISTPVWPLVRTRAVTESPPSSSATRTSTLDSISGWQSGISSLVFLAAMMPAISAVARTSPFLASPERARASVSGVMRTKPSATASRVVTALSETSTMWARPVSSIWVSLLTAPSDAA